MSLAGRRVAITAIALELVIVCAYLLANLFHVGGGIQQFAPLLGAVLGGGLTLFALFVPPLLGKDDPEPWVGYERLTWILIGCGQLMWAVGEGFWRYYQALHQTPFPSWADAGYVWFPTLCFVGLLLQPHPGTRTRQLLVALDSLIAMGALLAISWYLLLGSLAQAPAESALAKFLGLYYPTADVCLLSCVVFLLLRGQSQLYQVTARKVSLFVVGSGLCLFAISDFVFNLQQNAQTYVDGTWTDLGWPLGMITIGLAAYLRVAFPRTAQEVLEKRAGKYRQYTALGLQLLPYALIAILFGVLFLNVISPDRGQAQIRLVLLVATVGVVALVVFRQIITIRENERLSLLQAQALERIEDQARHIAERNTELEEGISHLKAVQTSLANGNLRARAQLKQGVLWSLASSLNLLAERQASLGEAARSSERLRRALVDLSIAVERARMGHAFQLPPSCENLPEIHSLIHAMGIVAYSPHQRLAAKTSPSGDRVNAGKKQTEPISYHHPVR